MPVVHCPKCQCDYDPGHDEDAASLPSDMSLKVVCPSCGQWLRLPEGDMIPAPAAPPEILREMMSQSRLVKKPGPAAADVRSISVSCPCGAKLEIDAKFLGKEIQCPDCQRPLQTKPPTTPPPLDLPEYRRTSGLAVLSLTLSLVFGFVFGGIAGIVVGIVALKEIAAHPSRLSGANLARAGITTGIVSTFLLLAGLISPYVFGVDELLRELAYAKRTDRTIKEIVSVSALDRDITMKRPSKAWGQYAPSPSQNSAYQSDPLILVSIRDDAFLACQDMDVDGNDDEDTVFKKVIERVRKSEVVNLVGRLGRNAAPEATIREKKPVGADLIQELIVDLRLGGHDRTFLIQYKTKIRTKLYFFVGCARASRFERVEKDFREALSQFKAN